MTHLRQFTLAVTVAAILCVAPGISALATAGQAGSPGCCKPTSPCGTGLAAADCCRAERHAQSEAPAIGPAAITKKLLQAAGGSGVDSVAGGIAGAPSLRPIGEIVLGHAEWGSFSPPLFLKNSALLI